MSLISRLETLAAAGRANPFSWDLSRAYYDPPSTTAYDLGTTVLNSNGDATSRGSRNVVAATSAPDGVNFSADGTKLFVTDTTGIYEFDLPIKWWVQSAVYTQTKAWGGNGRVADICFSPDGTKLIGVSAVDNVLVRWDLSTPWDVSTMSFVQSISIPGTTSGVHASDDGLYVFYLTSQTSEITRLTLSAAWDLSTASTTDSLSVSAYNLASGLSFSPDGTKLLFESNISSHPIVMASLPVPWVLSSPTYTTATQQFSSASGRHVVYARNGGTIAFSDSPGDTIYQIGIGGVALEAADAALAGLYIREDGLKLYVVSGATGDRVSEYDYGTAYNTTTLSYVQSVSVGDSGPKGVFFKPDGTKMYVVADTANTIREFSLSTPWDLSTAVFSVAESVSAQDANPCDVHFKSDGTVMYVAGAANDRVYQYSLSSPWDISSATYTQQSPAITGNMTGFSIRSDGKVLVTSVSNVFYQYELTSSWDITTLTDTGNVFWSVPFASGISGVAFSDDGLSFYSVTNDGNATYGKNNIYTFRIETPT